MTEDEGSKECGVGIRGVAMGIDAVAWFLLFMVAGTLVGAATGQIEPTANGVSTDLEGLAALASLGLWFAFAIGYHTVLEWRYGRTLGKYLVSIEVVHTGGSPLTLRGSLIRNVARLVDWWPLLYAIGILAVLVSTHSQRLGDRLAGTVVVRR